MTVKHGVKSMGIALFLGAVVAVPSWSNVLVNGGFETLSSGFPQGWAKEGPIASLVPEIVSDNATFCEGSHSVRMHGNGIPNCYGKVRCSAVITSGRTYKFSVKLKAQNIYSLRKSVLVKIIWYQTASSLQTTFIDEIDTSGGEWLVISRTITPPATANRCEIHLEMRWTESGTVWWDDVVLEAVAKPAARTIKVGTVYFKPPNGTVTTTLAAMSSLLDQAGAAGCDIVCLGEGWATLGTSIGSKKDSANMVPGTATAMVAAKAQQYSMYVVAGFYDWNGDTLYNVGVLFDRQGKQAGYYKKVHLPNSEQEWGVVPGSEHPVFDTDFGKIGIQICWDYAFPEGCRILAVKGAEMIFCPIWGDIRGKSSDSIYGRHIWPLMSRARAIDNGVYFVASIYHGDGMIIAPDGDILARTSGQTSQLVTATADMDFNPQWEWLGAPGIGEWNHVWKGERRSDVYGELSTYLTTPQVQDTTTGGGQKKTALPANRNILVFENPLTAQTTIQYHLPADAAGKRCRLLVTDTGGKVVRDLASGVWNQHQGSVVWERDDNNGNTVNDGVYLCKLQYGGKEIVQKMVLIK